MVHSLTFSYHLCSHPLAASLVSFLFLNMARMTHISEYGLPELRVQFEGRNFLLPIRLRPRFLPLGFFLPALFAAYLVLPYARFLALTSSAFFHAASSFFVAVTASRLNLRRISSRPSQRRCTMWKQSMMMVALGKHSRTMAYIESLKSIVTSFTFSRSASGIFFRILETTSAFVPLTTATMVLLPPCPALLENIVYTSSPIVVSSMESYSPRFFARGSNWPIKCIVEARCLVPWGQRY